jgi:hypothetical protein
VARDAQTPDWLLERTGFEPSSPFNSCSFGDLVGIWILPRKIALAERVREVA